VTPRRLHAGVAGALLVLAAGAARAADDAPAERALSGTITGYGYLLPDQPNYGMAVGSVNYGALHLEARYNYEARASTSAFVGWTFAGGKDFTWEVTPIIGTLFGRTHGLVPGVEAGVAYKAFDAYIEAEYVFDRQQSSGNYLYAWSELGWKPLAWLRVGVVGQRTRVVDNGRDLQRGVLLQVFAGKATVSAYAFNPDNSKRYATLAVGVDF
jgi:hypothetical protein